MPAEHRPRSRFDEQAALAELERLQRAIEESRRQRKDAVARFDQFVASFQPPPSVKDRVEVIPAASPGPAPSTSAAQGPGPFTRVVHREATHLPPRDAGPVTDSVTPPPPVVPPVAPVTAVPAERARVPEAFVVPDAPASTKDGRRVARGPVIAIAALAVVAILAAVLLMRPAPSPVAAPERAPASATAAPPPVPEPAAEPPATPAATPATIASPDVPGVHGELTTIRTAWVRVTIDGERAFERELPPNTRIPLNAERTIAVRVGDAGAVRLTIDGRDLGALGDEGQVVTRTFTARQPAPR